MGDRGNLCVRQSREGDDIWFYTHWRGDALPRIVARALALKKRWDDAPYLTRIIFATLTHHDPDNTTGFGISCRCGDNSDGNPIIVVDIPEQSVYQIGGDAVMSDGKIPFGTPAGVPNYKFKEWINREETNAVDPDES